MRPTHLPSYALIREWPAFTKAAPMRVMTSACIGGELCGVDGSSNGEYPLARRLLALPNVHVVKFCPEHEAFGTPRRTPDLLGGDGFDVLDGRARVVNDSGEDWTQGLVTASTTMRDRALEQAVHVALLMDISAACGSTVIYDGPRRLKVYQRGPGVAAAALMRAGIPIVSQRDERTLALLFAKLGVTADGNLLSDGFDHYERAWYRDYFANHLA